MKKLIVLLLATAFVSCQKETFKPSGNTKIEPSGNKIECIYLLPDNASVSGYIDFYVGQELNYTYNFTHSDLKDTVLFDEQPLKYLKITRYISNEDIRESNGWFYVNIFLDDEIEQIMNTNYVNGGRALNGNEFLPEPSDLMEFNVDYLYNSFKVGKKKPKIEILLQEK